jgi:hypothetical protein
MTDYETKMKTRWASRQNTHSPGRYVGSSTITKKTAVECARFLADWVHRGVWREDAHWMGKPLYEFGHIGNTLSDAVLHPDDGWQEGEFTVWMPVGVQDDKDLAGTWKEWVLSGHPDAATVDEDGVWFGEHKAHADCSPWKMEVAKRQVTLCLALAWFSGHAHFEPAEYARVGHPGFQWERSEVGPAGIVLGFTSWYQANVPRQVPVTQEQLRQVLDYYLAKGKAIVESALADDMEVARGWDDGPGKDEFDEGFRLLSEPQSSLDVAVEKERRGKRMQQEGDAMWKEGRKDIEAAVKAMGLWDEFYQGHTFDVGECAVRYKRVSGRKYASVSDLEAAGLEDYIKVSKESEYVEVR